MKVDISVFVALEDEGTNVPREPRVVAVVEQKRTYCAGPGVSKTAQRKNAKLDYARGYVLFKTELIVLICITHNSFYKNIFIAFARSNSLPVR